MLIESWKNCPGPGDCSPTDEADHDATRAAIADVLFAQWMASESMVNDIQGTLNDAEYAAINAELMADALDEDDAELGRVLRQSVKRAMRAAAQTEAALRYRKIHRADLRDLM